MAFYVSGFMCESVLIETGDEGVKRFSAIRLSDSLTLEVPGGKVPEGFSFPVPANFLLVFSSEEAHAFDVRLQVTDPTGTVKPIQPKPYVFDLKGGSGGHTLHVNLIFDGGITGVWWLSVLVGGKPELKIPWQVNHRPLGAPETNQKSPTETASSE